MKLFKYLPFAFAIAAMVGCSDDSFVEVPESGIMESDGSLTININLPTVSGSRATNIGDLNDGDAAEHAVSNARILLFDDSKKLITDVPLTGNDLPGFSEGAPEYITSQTAVIDINKGTATPKYALALLNTPEGFPSLTVGTSTFADVQAAIKTATMTSDYAKTARNSTGQFFMSNSTFDNTGSTAFHTSDGLQTLQEINPRSLAKTTSAAAETATDIYVERASAKVDLSFFTGLNGTLNNGSYSMPSSPNETGLPTVTFTATGDQLVVNGWTLNVTNQSYFPIKVITDTEWSRWNNKTTSLYDLQMGNHISEPKWFRTYWAVDPNYNTDADDTKFKYSTVASATNASKDVALYCLENTMIAGKQTQDQTTSILIGATYNLKDKTPGGDVYTINGKGYDATGLADQIAAVLDLVNYRKSSDNGTTLVKLKGSDFIVTALTSKTDVYSNLVKFNNTTNGLYLPTTTTPTEIIAKGATDAVNYAAMNDVLDATVGEKGLVRYISGKCYYSIPIRHFSDLEVKLYEGTGSNKVFATYNGQTVGVNSADQEGRYGVVRNHWYSVNVQSIAGIGKPDTGGEILPPTTPDDEENLYLNAKINILPWAKRSQNADI